MKLNLRKKISNLLQKLKGEKKQAESVVVVTSIDTERRPSDSSAAKKSSTSQLTANKPPGYFIKFDQPIIIPKKRSTGKNPPKIRGLPPQSYYVKKLWSNKGPIEPEND